MKDIEGIIAFTLFILGTSLVVSILCTAANSAIFMITELSEPEMQAEYVPPPVYAKSKNDRVPKNSIEEEIKKVFGCEWLLAVAVAKAESGLNPNAVNYNRNGTKDIGVFQINDCHYFTESERFDWRQNIRLAKQVKDTYGWKAWVAYKKGFYRQFL